jgi:hypothetical protein
VKTNAIPKHLLVAAAGKFEPGLAIGMRFKLKGGNSLFFIEFIYGKPLAFKREQFLRTFDQIEFLALPIHHDLRKAFNGKIEVEALTEVEIRAAIEHYHKCAAFWQFPSDYLKNLERALEINTRSDCLVAFEALYD